MRVFSAARRSPRCANHVSNRVTVPGRLPASDRTPPDRPRISRPVVCWVWCCPIFVADAEGGFQPVQRDIQQQGTQPTPLRGPGVGRMPTIRVQIPCLEPLPDAFPTWEGSNGLQEVSPLLANIYLHELEGIWNPRT